MTEAASIERKPRRKWGWIFIILFLVQAFVCVAIIGNNLAEAARTRDMALYWARQGDAARAMSAAYRARQLTTEANMLMVVTGILSIGTLTAAFFGLRRRK